MSLKEISEQKKAEFRYKWEAKIKTEINKATESIVRIETGLYPGSRMNELNTEANIITSILNESKIKYTIENAKLMGWTEWKYLIRFTINLGS